MDMTTITAIAVILLSVSALSIKKMKKPWGREKGDLKLKTKIKELRKQHKLSQAELADAVGTTRQTITSIEVGKYTASLVLAYKIAKYFNMTIEEVFDFSEVEDE